MSDLISRKAAIDLIDEYMDNCIELHYLPTGGGIKTLISALPSAQPERKMGKWIIDEKRFGNAEHHCNLCGAILEGDEWKLRNNYFCYHCGADMRGERNE